VNIDDWLLEILACPQCRAGLRADESASELVCTGCGLAYPVRDDIPVLLIDEARRPGEQAHRPAAADDPAAQPAAEPGPASAGPSVEGG